MAGLVDVDVGVHEAGQEGIGSVVDAPGVGGNFRQGANAEDAFVFDEQGSGADAVGVTTRAERWACAIIGVYRGNG